MAWFQVSSLRGLCSFVTELEMVFYQAKLGLFNKGLEIGILERMYASWQLAIPDVLGVSLLPSEESGLCR